MHFVYFLQRRLISVCAKEDWGWTFCVYHKEGYVFNFFLFFFSIKTLNSYSAIVNSISITYFHTKTLQSDG